MGNPTIQASLLCSLLTVAGLAHGDVSAKKAKTVVLRPALAEAVADAKRMDPSLFTAVQEVQHWDPQAVDADRQQHYVHVIRALKGLGPKAFLPMISTVAGSSFETLPGTVKAATLESIGILRDPRALPVLFDILDGSDNSPQVLYAATAAIGRQADDTIAQRLVQSSRKPRGGRSAVVRGLGECRHPLAVGELASLLGSSSDPEMRQVAAEALGLAASSWAWSTPRLTATHQGPAVRASAAQALVKAYGTTEDDDFRGTLRASLAMVEAPETVRFIETALTHATGKERDALRELQASWTSR